MTRNGTSSGAMLRFRCGRAARALPRALALALLLASLLAATRLDPERTLGISRWARNLVPLAGLLAALWIARTGSEVRVAVELVADRIRMRAGKRAVEFPLAQIVALDFDPPFAQAGRWLPALVLVDAHDRRIRVSALLENSDRLLSELIRRAADPRLEAWERSRGVRSRMVRSRKVVAAGYLAAAAVVLVALLFAATVF